ncbi:Triosephosphate isomerase, partial [Haemophilus influenzae]
RRKIYHYWSL